MFCLFLHLQSSFKMIEIKNAYCKHYCHYCHYVQFIKKMICYIITVIYSSLKTYSLSEDLGTLIDIYNNVLIWQHSTLPVYTPFGSDLTR